MKRKTSFSFAFLSLIRIFALQLEAKAFITLHSDSSAVGSVLRSGRRGREFESPLSDNHDETNDTGKCT